MELIGNDRDEVTVRSDEDALMGWTFALDDTGARLANEPAENGYDLTETRCAYCGEADPDEDDVCMSPESEDDKHKPETTEPALSWVNSARITADPDRDTLTVAISVGDPRGAFTMTVERLEYFDHDRGEMVTDYRLSVPHPDDSSPHMTLTPLASPGYYRFR